MLLLAKAVHALSADTGCMPCSQLSIKVCKFEWEAENVILKQIFIPSE